MRTHNQASHTFNNRPRPVTLMCRSGMPDNDGPLGSSGCPGTPDTGDEGGVDLATSEAVRMFVQALSTRLDRGDGARVGLSAVDAARRSWGAGGR